MNKVKAAMKKNTMLFVLVIVTVLFQILITINGKRVQPDYAEQLRCNSGNRYVAVYLDWR